MRKISFALGIICLCLIFSCSKSDDSCGYPDSSKVAPQSEQDNLADSLEKYNIQANLAPSGFYYSITNAGTGAIVANLCNTVSAKYWGGFFNGNGFDSSSVGNIFDPGSKALSFVLGQTIIGWQKAIPLVKEGGEINIYIPPSLAYGSDPVADRNGRIIIPANSYLVFKVQVDKIR